MTMVMSWNIQFFSEQNFSNVTRASGLSANHIVDAINATDPDILVIIEVRSGASTGIGSLITDTGGAAGVRALHARLGGTAAGWYVVPPQVLNRDASSLYNKTKTKYFEGIAVFFRSRNLDFIGPWLWTSNGPKPRNLAVPPAGIQAYGGTWAGVLPHTVPAGCGFQGHYQDEFAGQAFFSDSSNQTMWFPATWARMPFLTAFWDKENNRVIKLMAVHLPPQITWSKQAMKTLGEVDVLTTIPSDAVNTDTQGAGVILGDFNVNLLNPNQVDLYEVPDLDEYPRLTTDRPTATLIRGLGTKSPPALNVFKTGERGWWKRDRQQGCFTALDAMLVGYYGAHGGGPALNYTVKDWVRTPKPSLFPPNANAYMATRVQDLQSNLSGFKGMWNYAKMRDASDHLAIVADI
jgi:hypothetical protein